MNADEKILRASLDAMRELSVEQLWEWRDGIEHDVHEAIAATEALIDFVIAEKMHNRSIN